MVQISLLTSSSCKRQMIHLNGLFHLILCLLWCIHDKWMLLFMLHLLFAHLNFILYMCARVTIRPVFSRTCPLFGPKKCVRLGFLNRPKWRFGFCSIHCVRLCIKALRGTVFLIPLPPDFWTACSRKHLNIAYNFRSSGSHYQYAEYINNFGCSSCYMHGCQIRIFCTELGYI